MCVCVCVCVLCVNLYKSASIFICIYRYISVCESIYIYERKCHQTLLTVNALTARLSALYSGTSTCLGFYVRRLGIHVHYNVIFTCLCSCFLRLIDFKGMSTSLGLSYAKRLGNCVHCTFIFLCICLRVLCLEVGAHGLTECKCIFDP